MTGVKAVLFDYGRTLVTFEYPTQELLGVLDHFRPAIAASLGGRSVPSAQTIVDTVLLPLEGVVDSPGDVEVSYRDVYRDAWHRAGLSLPDELLEEILDAEQLVWDRAARVDPGAMSVLSWLGGQGYRRAVCSNAPFPPEMMLRQVSSNGIAGVMDAVVFSSQVGRRKPAPEAYAAALAAVRALPSEALFVGDRVREDYEGPRAIGMRAVICTAHAIHHPPAGVPTIASLGELPALLSA